MPMDLNRFAGGFMGGAQQGMGLAQSMRQAKMQEFAAQREAEKQAFAMEQQQRSPVEYGGQTIDMNPAEKADFFTKLALARASSQQKQTKPVDLNAEETKRVMDAAQSAGGLAGVGREFKASKIGETPSVGRVLKGLPLIGQGGWISGPLDKIMPDTTAYLNKARQQVEGDLRAATGAAAPESEVKTYMSFMPQPGDTDELAAKKLEDYYSKLRQKVEGVAAVKEAQGDYRGAQMIRQNMKQTFANSGLDKSISDLRGPGEKDFSALWK